MNASSLTAEMQEAFARDDLKQEALREVVRVEAGRILWSGSPGTGRTVEWDLGLARYMAASFAKTPSTRLYAVALTGVIAEAEAYHKEHV